MSILIKGMEMPQGNSTINVLIYADGTVYTGHVNDSQYSAVSVPTPHGRLIDADEIEMPCLETTADQKWMEIAIKSTPTIIEAEGSET